MTEKLRTKESIDKTEMDQETYWQQYKEEGKKAEIFLALVGATGTDLGQIELGLADALRAANYSISQIHLSSLIQAHFGEEKSNEEFVRIKRGMELGNKLRLIRKEAVALLGVLDIRQQRRDYWAANQHVLPGGTHPNDFPKIPIVRRAYIIRSLKHPSEVEILRAIYGESFYLVSAYASRTKRKQTLEARIAKSEMQYQFDRRSKKADILMRRDYIESELSHGQNVRDTFPLADLFVNTDKAEECQLALARFVRMILGDSRQTPTVDEYCMFHAKGCALRSGDLGRQVGAIIASSHGDVISHGTNEAPKAHGGQFWIGDNPDGRGIAQEADISDERKRSLFVDLITRLSKNNRISLTDGNTVQSLEAELFSDLRPSWMKGSDILELIGFYRSVHGETAAIVNAGRLGRATAGANMYVTAFPCHECARHILAAGIERVTYIEPYPKSLAGKNYPESIVIDEDGDESQISFQQYVGIAPRIYMRFFEALERKNKDGTAIKWDPHNCSLRYYHHWLAYTEKETALCFDFQSALHKEQTSTRGA